MGKVEKSFFSSPQFDSQYAYKKTNESLLCAYLSLDTQATSGICTYLEDL